MNSSDTRSIARSAKKASVATKTTAPARRPVAAAEDEPQWNLSPGFRNRLVGRLDASGVPQNARTAYVAALTERAPQTVSRWLAAQGAGLPDLESCARLCQGLRCSADWILGMTRLGIQRRNRQPFAGARCAHLVRRGRHGGPFERRRLARSGAKFRLERAALEKAQGSRR